MTKLSKIFIGCLVAGATLFAAPVDKSKVIKELSNLRVVKDYKFKVVDYKNISSLYAVKVKSILQPKAPPQTFWITKDKKVIVSGVVIDAESLQPIGFVPPPPPPPKALDVKNDTPAFVYGTGKTLLYVFTNPNCGHCKQFEKLIEKNTDKYTFKIFLFPFDARGEKKSRWILNAKTDKDKARRLISTATDFTTWKKDKMSAEDIVKTDKILKEQLKIVRKHKLNSTPTVLDKDGLPFSWGVLAR